MTEREHKLKVLFVDDEPEILNGLRLTLRKQKKFWDILFATSGAEAVELLSQHELDAVVTDMQMPGIDGAELLTRVRTVQPQACRLVISGHADDVIAMRALSIAHQFLSKPVTREEIVRSIEKTYAIMNLVKLPQIKNIIGDTTSLPATPRLYQQLIGIIHDENCGVDEVAAIIEQDPGMSAKFLQLANSAYFSMPRAVVAVADAVAFLGFSTVCSIALSKEAMQAFPKLKNLHSASLASFQHRSNLCATVAARIAKDMKLDPSIASTSGTLHATGLLLLEARAPERCAEAWERALEDDVPLHEAEQLTMGTDHALIGGALLGSWGLPAPVVETVLHQYNPGHVSKKKFSLAGALHIASYLVNVCMDRVEAHDQHATRKLDVRYVNATGVSEKASEWMQFTHDLVQKLENNANQAA